MKISVHRVRAEVRGGAGGHHQRADQLPGHQHPQEGCRDQVERAHGQAAASARGTASRHQQGIRKVNVGGRQEDDAQPFQAQEEFHQFGRLNGALDGFGGEDDHHREQDDGERARYAVAQVEESA